MLVNTAAWLLYFSLMESSSWQATFGKLILGIKVVDKANNKLSFWHALGRYFAKYVCWFTMGIGFLVIGFTEKKQGLHDLIAGTYVIKK